MKCEIMARRLLDALSREVKDAYDSIEKRGLLNPEYALGREGDEELRKSSIDCYKKKPLKLSLGWESKYLNPTEPDPTLRLFNGLLCFLDDLVEASSESGLLDLSFKRLGRSIEEAQPSLRARRLLSPLHRNVARKYLAVREEAYVDKDIHEEALSLGLLMKYHSDSLGMRLLGTTHDRIRDSERKDRERSNCGFVTIGMN